MLAMLEAGELDAAIFGADMPKSDALRRVFADDAAEEFRRVYGFMPVNHLLVARADAADAAADVLGLMAAAEAGAPSGLPRGRAALMPSLGFAAHFCVQQGLISRAPSFEEIWAGLPDTIA
jgi:4,5-dihydroxyphthalate decarboxylase